MKLLETIRYEGGSYQLLTLHQTRMIRSLQALAPQSKLCYELQTKGLEKLINEQQDHINLAPDKIYKTRLIYDGIGIIKLEVIPYKPIAPKGYFLYEVDEDFDYKHKYLNRSCLNPLTPQQATLLSDYLPIFLRKGLLTDTSFTNIILKLDDELYTPKEPLLRGVMREYLLQSGAIKAQTLGLEELRHCEEIYLINAMLPLEQAIKLPKEEVKL